MALGMMLAVMGGMLVCVQNTFNEIGRAHV